ncbi:hypothetical protein FGO68_gene10054 [Halteria grandinella]|uniref:Uncharacterized protein n=1 Tax=Halteria grandinella TaxID=5974 RepID=A0A8J8T622_HALGN|nr:hypothetical protein FGO68_gene10054 [Halteria grandinella]
MIERKLLITTLIILHAGAIINSQKSELQSLKSPADEIIAGKGYSEDTKSVAVAACYQPISTALEGQKSSIFLSSSLSYYDLQERLGYEHSANAGYGLFRAQINDQQMNSLNETNFSLSYNYLYRVASSNVSQFSYNSMTMLSQVGVDIYQNGTNPLFRIICGEKVITQYDVGAYLILSMIVEFESSDQKRSFTSEVSGNIGSFLTATSKAQQAAQKTKINGKITITGQQLGGDPTQLGNILNDQGSCSLQNPSECQKIVQSLSKYFSETFPSQFKKNAESIWTSPLVKLGSFAKGYNLRVAGFQIGESYVTKEVEEARSRLIQARSSLQDLKNNLTNLQTHYPVELDSEFKLQIEITLKKVQQNIDQFYGADECWMEPYNCVEVAEKILGKLQSIEFENHVCPTYYKVTSVVKGHYWRTGGKDNQGNTLFGVSTPYYYSGGWYIHNQGSTCWLAANNQSFYAKGGYHDQGACPIDDQYNMNITVDKDLNLRDGVIHAYVHQSGGCRADYWHDIGFSADQLASPYCFNGFDPQSYQEKPKSIISPLIRSKLREIEEFQRKSASI